MISENVALNPEICSLQLEISAIIHPDLQEALQQHALPVLPLRAALRHLHYDPHVTRGENGLEPLHQLVEDLQELSRGK